MDREPVTLEGLVERRNAQQGTASEHQGSYLVTSDRAYLLQRIGANPFQDPVLDTLAGKHIRCTGYTLPSGILRVTALDELPDKN